MIFLAGRRIQRDASGRTGKGRAIELVKLLFSLHIEALLHEAMGFVATGS
jgi:hypothetical protein